MAKQLNVNLAFNADTSKAKQQIQDLQNQLSAIINMPTAGLGADIATKINQASRAAAELKVHLEKATNVKTGNLDFTKLNQSIKNSGSSLSEYAAKLKEIGPQGQSAFNSLAQAVASAEVPIRRSNALLSELWVTMQNTVRWQLTSSMLHGFMGAVQSAVGYTKDLNESLNNIRIVTGQSVEQMADFAKEANKAAKSLSTSTLNYTDAALIYYQQGLDDTQVKERTDITIKMANVSRQSAEEVSDQMTAVWNNFYDGSQSLEHFADVMTRLGADTASSSDEIAQGLEKFASIGNMIGLSFDNAAAALATVTATTRQSADVVGTAFKTIFARIQGLSLGETLDDGTNLNKYSKALQAVGINVKEQNGELKDMDSILAEMGAKWKTLSKDQQVALAQTVAGVRQYNQLIALMDHFDFYEQNLAAAQNSEGTLQEQADIYAESWQAAAKRVRASWEDLWGSLIDDKAFISILNTLSKIVDGFDLIIDSAGGLGGVISSLGLIFSQVFQKQILSSITNASYSLKSWTESGRESIRQEKSAEINHILSLQGEAPKGSAQDVQNQVIKAQLESQQKLIDNAKNLTEEEQKVYQILLDQQKVRGDLAVKAAQEVEQKKKQVNKQKINLISGDEGANSLLAQLEEDAIEKAKYAEMDISELDDKERENLIALNNRIASSQKGLIQTYKYSSKDITNFTESVTDLAIAEKRSEAATNEAKRSFEISNQQTKENTQDTQNNTQATQNNTQATQNNTQAKDKGSESSKRSGEAIDKETQERKEENDAIRESNGLLDENNNKKNQGKTALYAKNFLSGAQAAMGMVSAINALSSAYQTLNSNATPTEKLASITMSLSMSGGMLYSSLAKLNKITLSNGTSLGQMASQSKLLSGVIGKLGLSTASTGVQIAALGVYVAAAVAVIAALGYGIKVLIDIHNKDAIAAERAAKAYKDLSDQADEATSKVEQIVSTFEEYDSIVEKLKECDKGTEEWQNALDDVNKKIWDILETYPELAKFDNLFTEDGLLNKDAIEEFIKSQKDAANSIKSAAITAQAYASQAKVKSDSTDLKRQIVNETNLYGTGEQDFYTNNSEAANKMINELTDYVKNNKDLTYDEFMKEVNKYKDSFSILEGQQNNFSNYLKGTAKQIWDLGKAASAADTQMSNVGKLISKEILGNNTTEEQSKDFSNTYDEEYEKQYNEIYKEATGSGISQTSGKDNAIVQDLWAQYQAATGTNYQLSSNAVQGNDQNRVFEYLKDGIKVQITAEELATAIASANAKNEAENQSRDDIESSLEKNFGLDVFNENVSTSLLNSLLQAVNDERLTGSFANIFNSDQTAEEQEKIIQQLLEVKDTIKEVNIESESEKYGLDAEIVTQQAKEIQKAYNLTENQAKKLAIENARVEKGVESLDKSWEEWNKTLSQAKTNKAIKTTSQYAEAIKDTTKAVGNLVGAVGDFELPDSFFESEENIALIGKAAKGDIEAIDALGFAVANSQIDTMSEEISDKFKAAAGRFEPYIQTVKNGIQQLQDNWNNIEIGTDVFETLGDGWVDALNKMARATEMSVDEMNSLLNELGVETDVTTTPVTQYVRVPRYKTVTTVKKRDEFNFPIETYTTTSQDGTDVVKETIDVAQINTGDEAGTPPTITKVGNGSSVTPPSASKSKGGGGSSSKASKVSMTKKSDVVDRYKEIDDQLDDINDELSRTNKLTDRLFGAKRLQQMDKEISILNKQSKALEKKRKEAENYLKIDKQAVLDLNKTYGTQFKIDDSGLISNYEDELSKLYNDLHAAEQKSQSYYTSGASKDVQDKFNESTLEPIKEKISVIKEVLSQYDETRELLEDLNDQIQDINNQIQDLNYEKIQYKLELKIDIEDAELKRLDYFLNKFSDDFYKMAESAVLMMDKIEPSSNILEDYKENVNELNKAYQNGDISQADYIEGLKNARDAIYEQLEALNELDKQMLHYYEDTLSAATDELADHTDHMEHLTSVFEHYQNLLSIIGKSKDYEAMGNFLQGQANTIKDRLSVAQSYYDVLLQQKDEIQAELQAAIKSGDEAKIEMYQKEWDAIVDETDAAQEQVLSLTEEWAEAMKSVIQNNMEKIADTLEKTLTGGTTFDTLMDGFDKLNTRQEEYLTKTNQIYETNKLMRTASKALDETDNKVAKQKLKNFIDETKGLQETTQLSKYELEIQQAKYDLLLAQIALEEAQNAKSTVRLSRDNEGNFGYVYTADQNKIDDAQQAVDDADNKLYNLSLEGQQQYTEKYLQAEQAMYEELKQLQQDYLDGNIASEEEYELRKSQIQEHYLGPEGVLTTYSKLYNVAVQTDANATADYWGQEYGRMTQDTEAWKTAVNDYLLEIDDQIEEWKNVQTIANDEVGGALNNSKKATEDLTTESRNLRDTINDEVIPAISDEIDAVREQTDAYADQRQKLLDLIATYEEYLKQLDATISVNSIGFDKDTDYSALMNEYLSKGGKTSDDTYKQLLAQRNAKIDWLKTQGKDKNYWGTYGDETTDMYDRLLSGENWTNSKGQDMQNWFKADYVDDSKLTEIFETLGVPIEEIQTLLTDLKDSTGEKIDATKDTIQTSTDNINTKISETTESVNTKVSEIGESINTKVGETSDNLNNTFNETKDILNEDINVFKDETINAFENIGQIIENGVESIVDSVNEAAGEISSSVGSGFSEVRGEISGLQSQINSLRSSQSIYGLASFDTGGYTGNWGPEGKLAMLHEKELILNESDTSNLLSTISFIRELVNMIDAQAASASLFNLMSTPSPNPNANTLEQKVEITAEFPNVNDRYEIEEAFNNLVNRASQYANKAF